MPEELQSDVPRWRCTICGSSELEVWMRQAHFGGVIKHDADLLTPQSIDYPIDQGYAYAVLCDRCEDQVPVVRTDLVPPGLNAQTLSAWWAELDGDTISAVSDVFNKINLEALALMRLWHEQIKLLPTHPAQIKCPLCEYVVIEADSDAQKRHLESKHPELIPQRLTDAGFQLQPDGAWQDMLVGPNS